MPRLVHYASCGTAVPIVRDGSTPRCRRIAAAVLRLRRREGFRVALVARGREWEIQDPTKAPLLPDACGVLSLEISRAENRDR